MEKRKAQNAESDFRHFILTKRFHLLSLCVFLFAFLLCPPVKAQVEEPPEDAAPPPVYVIPKDEKKLLEDTKDLKKRTQLSLELLEAHLAKAEKLAEQNSFQNALSELGNYRAIIENVFDVLNRNNNGRHNVDNNYKRLEIGLRQIVPRLENLRRAMPYNYGYYVRELQKFVRDARAKALEPLFDDSVVRQKNQ